MENLNRSSTEEELAGKVSSLGILGSMRVRQESCVNVVFLDLRFDCPLTGSLVDQVNENQSEQQQQLFALHKNRDLQ